MSRNELSWAFTVLMTVLMVTSTIAPVAAAGSTSSSDQTDGLAEGSYDFSGINGDQPATTQASEPASAAIGQPGDTPNTQPAFSDPDLEALTASFDRNSAVSENGTLRILANVKGTYKTGQYPWEIPVRVSVTSAALQQNAVVYLRPDEGASDYAATANFTFRFDQDDTKEQTLTLTASPEVSSDLEASDTQTIKVEGQSDQSSVIGSVQINSREVKEDPRSLSRVSRYRATQRADGYLEDASLPVGNNSRVSNFTFARNADGDHAVLNSLRGSMNVGTLTTGIANGSTQSLVIAYSSLEQDPITVTPVDSNGFAIDNQYTLPAKPGSSDFCRTNNEGDGERADVCIFRLSDLESDTISQQNELVLSYSSPKKTSVSLFCQDVITGGMPDSGVVCGLGDVVTSASGNIVKTEAFDGRNSAFKQGTLRTTKDQITLSVSVKNNGDARISKAVSLDNSITGEELAEKPLPEPLAPGDIETVTFEDIDVGSDIMELTAAFDGSTSTVTVEPATAGDDTKPVSLPGTYVVRLNEIGESRQKIGTQEQTLTQNPNNSENWVEVAQNVGRADGTEQWETQAYNVPVVGNLTEIDKESKSIGYINDALGSDENIEEAYSEYIGNTRRQLPALTGWTLEDVSFTSKVTTQREISTDRPQGLGWKRVDRYGEVATGEFERQQFRTLSDGRRAIADGTVVDTDGSGWVKQTDVAGEPQRKLTGYDYNTTTKENRPSGAGWEEVRRVGTKEIPLDGINQEKIIQESRYDPGGAYEYIGTNNDGNHVWVDRKTKEVTVYKYQRPVYDFFYTYERPKTETTYKWKRNIYDAQFTYERETTNDQQLSLWRGPQYKYVTEYEPATVELNANTSFDEGPVNSKGIRKYEWQFENGATAPGKTVKRTYDTPFGTYRPALTVTDKTGNSDTKTAKVRVIKDKTGTCPAPCASYKAQPRINVSALRDPVSYHLENIPYKVDIEGKLDETDWEVKITTSDPQVLFEKDVWSGFDLNDDKQTEYGNINPRKYGIKGDVTLEVTANPVGETEPIVTDTTDLYVCDAKNPDEPAYSNNGCDEMDQDGDGTTEQGGDGEPTNKTTEGNQTTTENTTIVNESKITWTSANDWKDATKERIKRSQSDNEQFEQDSPLFSAVVQIGYSQESENLIGFYDMNRVNPTTENRTVRDVSSQSNHGVIKLRNYNGAYKEDVDVSIMNDHSPVFKENRGVFGSTGMNFTDSNRGYVELDALAEESDRNGQTITFWERSKDGYEGTASDTLFSAGFRYDTRGDDDSRNDIERGVHSVVTNITASPTVFGTQFSQEIIIGDNRTGTGYAPNFTTESFANEGLENAFDGTRGGDEWNHIAYVVDNNVGANEKSSKLTVYVNGQAKQETNVNQYSDDPLAGWNTLGQKQGDDTYNGDDPRVNVKKLMRLGAGIKEGPGGGVDKLTTGREIDNLRVFNEALDGKTIETEAQRYGEMTTGRKSFKEAKNISGGLNVSLEGTLTGGNVNVTVELLNDDSGDTYESAPIEFSQSGDGKKKVEGLPSEAKYDGAKLNVNISTDKPAQSPVVNRLTLHAGEVVEVEKNKNLPIPRIIDSFDTTSDDPGVGDEITFNGNTSNASIEDDYEASITSYTYTVKRPDSERETIESSSVGSGGEIPRQTFEFECGGPHEVRLEVTDTQGASNSTSETFDIPNEEPTAAIEQGPTLSVDAGETFELNGAVSTGSDDKITDYEWRSDADGNVQTGSTASFTFERPGVQEVDLLVEDEGCATDSTSITVSVQNDNPTADAGADVDVGVDERVTLDASGSSDPDGDALEYEWDLNGNGVYTDPSSSATIEHTFDTEGTKSVSLRVRDGLGGRGTDVVEVTVLNPVVVDDDFSQGSIGEWRSETGNLQVRSGDGKSVLAPSCSKSDMTNQLRRDVGTTADKFEYEFRYVPLDSWDNEFIRFQYRDDSGWHTVYQNTHQWDSRSGEKYDTIDCYRRFESDGTFSDSGTITDVDGTLHEIRFTNGLNQDDHDESLAIEFVKITAYRDTVQSCSDLPRGADSGTYTISVGGEAQEVYCEMNPDTSQGNSRGSSGGPVESEYTFKYVKNGITTNRVSDANSCKAAGMSLFQPRGPDEYDAGRNYVIDDYGYAASSWKEDPSNNNGGGLGPMGVHIDQNGERDGGNVNFDAEESRDLASPEYVSRSDSLGADNLYGQGTDGWRTTLSEQFWVAEDQDETEPNGDYEANTWLGWQSYDNEGYVSNYNDLSNANYGYDQYLCWKAP